MLISYYTKENDAYYFHVGREIRYIGGKIAIGFTLHPSYVKIILHKHGRPQDVAEWFDKAIMKIVQADVLNLVKDVKMLVFLKIDPDKINMFIRKPESLCKWAEDNNIRL